MAEAAIERAVPVLVAYDVPGRDCAQYSAGGALSQADYQAWISGFSQGIGTGKAVVILEPDALGNLPSNCGLPTSTYPFTDAERVAELQYAVGALERDPGVSVYLDGTHSAWQSVGTMTQRLLDAHVQDAQGFFLNVSNYQPTAELLDYGTWISDCIAMVTDSSNAYYGNPAACASQYYPATQSDFSTWDLTTQWCAQNMGSAVATTRFVADTSRNGTSDDVLMALNADQTIAIPSSTSRSTPDVIQLAAHDLQTPQISQRAAPSSTSGGRGRLRLYCCPLRDLELRPGNLFCHRGKPGTDTVMLGVLIVGPVRVRVLEVGDDREAPVALAQPEIVADRVAERARTIKVPEASWISATSAGSCPVFTTLRITGAS